MTAPHDITWRDGKVPVSTLFDDPFYSLDNGLAETRHVFLAGNGLPDRFRDGFHVAELGFGTGLNLVATLLAWAASGQTGQLNYTSFEAFPLPGETAVAALSAFPEAAPFTAQIAAVLAGGGPLDIQGCSVRIVFGDARDTLQDWNGQADAWFLDGFSPAKNPELWQPELLAAVAAHTAAHGTCSTYSAAGAIRRALAAGGFEVQRVPGFGRKRHMTVGQLR